MWVIVAWKGGGYKTLSNFLLIVWSPTLSQGHRSAFPKSQVFGVFEYQVKIYQYQYVSSGEFVTEKQNWFS